MIGNLSVISAVKAGITGQRSALYVRSRNSHDQKAITRERARASLDTAGSVETRDTSPSTARTKYRLQVQPLHNSSVRLRESRAQMSEGAPTARFGDGSW